MKTRKCPKCGNRMTGSARTYDRGTFLVTIWMCAHCMFRERTKEPNPRLDLILPQFPTGDE